jgi:protein ImuA
MPTQLLSRPGQRPRPTQPLLGPLTLARARVHEFCGPARRTLAAMLMRATEGPVIWISPGWLPARLFPDGLRDFADPGRVIFAQARRPEDLLWSMEEALHSGAVGLVLADLPAPPGLTPVRRLHLAAETGASEGRTCPLGVLMTPGEGGAQGVESRWHLAPHPVVAPPAAPQSGDTGHWRLERRRARTAPQKAWAVTMARRGHLRLDDAQPAPNPQTGRAPQPSSNPQPSSAHHDEA